MTETETRTAPPRRRESRFIAFLRNHSALFISFALYIAGMIISNVCLDLRGGEDVVEYTGHTNLMFYGFNDIYSEFLFLGEDDLGTLVLMAFPILFTYQKRVAARLTHKYGTYANKVEKLIVDFFGANVISTFCVLITSCIVVFGRILTAHGVYSSLQNSLSETFDPKTAENILLYIRYPFLILLVVSIPYWYEVIMYMFVYLIEATLLSVGIDNMYFQSELLGIVVTLLLSLLGAVILELTVDKLTKVTEKLILKLAVLPYTIGYHFARIFVSIPDVREAVASRLQNPDEGNRMYNQSDIIEV